MKKRNRLKSDKREDFKNYTLLSIVVFLALTVESLVEIIL